MPEDATGGESRGLLSRNDGQAGAAKLFDSRPEGSRGVPFVIHRCGSGSAPAAGKGRNAGAGNPGPRDAAAPVLSRDNPFAGQDQRRTFGDRSIAREAPGCDQQKLKHPPKSARQLEVELRGELDEPWRLRAHYVAKRRAVNISVNGLRSEELG